MSILVVGKNSFIAQHLARYLPEARYISHGDIKDVNMLSYKIILNLSLDPKFKTQPYHPMIDMDGDVGGLGSPKSHYIFLSTRKVYGRMPTSSAVMTEEWPPSCFLDYYAVNKLEAENRVRMLGRSTIFRTSTVIGYEPGRQSFMGVAQKSLAIDDEITLDSSPFVERDFIPVDQVAQSLAYWIRLVLENQDLYQSSHLFNLGSGSSIPIGKPIAWLIEGYGSGRLIIDDVSERDFFRMDTSKLKSYIGDYMEEIDIRAYCIELGKRLRQEVKTYENLGQWLKSKRS